LPAKPDFVKRRKFLGMMLMSAAAGLSIEHVLAQRRSCRINRVGIPISGLAPAFDGLRVAHLSDFHHGPLVSAEFIRNAVRLANHLRPDVIALTGDFIHRGSEWAEGCFHELSALCAPMGVFGVLGNHDHYVHASSAVRLAMGKAGIRDLTNRGIDLKRGKQTLRICGVGDLWKDKQDLRAALGATQKPDSAILLSHNPDYAESVMDDRVGLILSGHTHGGQCVLPLIGAPILPSRFGQKYKSGLCRAPVAKVFVTTGVGHSFPPVRWNCPSEIALLTLSRRPS